MPEGIGGAREENSAANQRVDTRKSEPVKSKNESKKSDKKGDESKKSDERAASKETTSKKEDKSNSSTPKSTIEKQESTTKKEDIKPKKDDAVAEKNEKKVKTEIPLSTKKTDNEFNNYLKWRVGVRGGFGNMLTKIPTEDAYSLYQEKLLRGFTWGADASYFFTDNIGFGMMFHNFQTSNKAESIAYRNEILNKVDTGSIANNVR